MILPTQKNVITMAQIAASITATRDTARNANANVNYFYRLFLQFPNKDVCVCIAVLSSYITQGSFEGKTNVKAKALLHRGFFPGKCPYCSYPFADEDGGGKAHTNITRHIHHIKNMTLELIDEGCLSMRNACPVNTFQNGSFSSSALVNCLPACKGTFQKLTPHFHIATSLLKGCPQCKFPYINDKSYSPDPFMACRNAWNGKAQLLFFPMSFSKRRPNGGQRLGMPNGD